MELIDHGAEERLVGVHGSFVVWKDVKLLRRYSGLNGMRDEDLESWLVSEFSFISKPHLCENIVNQEIAINGFERPVYRPVNYGRAAIFDTTHGYFDVKGIGVAPDKSPKLEFYKTGLINLVDALSEVIRENHVAKAVRGKIACVRTLAVISFPFVMADPLGTKMKIPCALIVREFFLRPSWVAQRYFTAADICTAVIECEVELRRMGITSCHPIREIHAKLERGTLFIKSGHEKRFTHIFSVIEHLVNANFISLPTTFEVPNIEFAIDLRGNSPGLLMIDFGGIRACEKFDKNVLTWAMGTETSFSILRRNDPDFVNEPNQKMKHKDFYGDAGSGQIDVFGARLNKNSATRGFFDLALAASNCQNKRLMRASLDQTISFWIQ